MFERRQKLIDLAREFHAGKSGNDVFPQAPVARRKIEIDALLRWAYREELPKAAPKDRRGPAGFVSISGYGVLGLGFGMSENQLTNRFGVTADLFAQTEPHPDAVAVAAAVTALDRLELCLPEDWDPFGDLGEMGGHRAASIAAVAARLCVMEASGAPRWRNSVAELMLRCAILGPPDCAADRPETRFVCGQNGRPKWFVRRIIDTDGGPMEIECDGMSASKKRPVDGAYRKTYLDPDPFEAGIARGEYEIWRAALGMLVEDLAEKCDSFEIAPCGLPWRPWDARPDDPHVGIILRDLSKA